MCRCAVLFACGEEESFQYRGSAGGVGRRHLRERLPGVNLVVAADTLGGFDETLVTENQQAAADPQLSDRSVDMTASSGLTRHAAADGMPGRGSQAG